MRQRMGVRVYKAQSFSRRHDCRHLGIRCVQRLQGATHLGASLEVDAAVRLPHKETSRLMSRDLAVSVVSACLAEHTRSALQPYRVRTRDGRLGASPASCAPGSIACEVLGQPIAARPA